MLLGLAAAASAQPKAVGIRAGYGLEASYQHNLGNNFIEAGLGLDGFKYFNVAATYNFNIIEFGDGFNFYAGPGITLGIEESIHLGIAGQAGIEYDFSFPLQISLDVRPQLCLSHQAFNFRSWYPSIGIRYRF